MDTISLREHVERILAEKELRSEDRFKYSQDALALALAASDRNAQATGRLFALVALLIAGATLYLRSKGL